MADEPADVADYERAARRRADRDEMRNWITLVIGLIPAFVAAFGFSPLTRIWSVLALLTALILVLAGSWWHHRGATFKSFMSVPSTGVGAKRSAFAYWAAVIGLIFGAGAWVGSSGRDTFLYLMYGSLGDLAISPANDIATPAVISLRKDTGIVCFFTTASFNVRNTRSEDVSMGVVSSSLSLSDDTNAPIFAARSLADITQTSGGVSGVRLITGTPNDWPRTIDTIKSNFTTLRRGEAKDITVFQNRDYNTTCLADPDGSLAKNYQASTVKISGEIVMTLPDGTWREESFGLSEPVKVVRQ